MKKFMLVLIAGLYALAQNTESPAAVLSGMVTSTDGQPLPGAKITLSADPALFLQGVRLDSQGRSTTTDAGGKYALEGISPGTYFVVANATGYITQSYGGKPGYFGSYNGRALPLSAIPVVVAGTNKTSNLNIALTRESAISGRVTSAGDDPVEGIPVYAVRWTYLDGTRKLLEKGRSTTGKQGEFKVSGLAPGQYFIYAAPPPNPGGALDQPKYTRLATFSPNTLRASEAVAVTLSAGADRVADVRLREDGKLTVRGTVLGPQGRPAAGATVVLMEDSDTPVAGGVSGAPSPGPPPFLPPPYLAMALAKPNGEFELEGVPPGPHHLIAFGGNRPTLNMSSEGIRSWSGALTKTESPDEGSMGAVDISVESRDVDGVEILLQPGGVITSKINMDSGSYQDWARKRIERLSIPEAQQSKLLQQALVPQVTLLPEAGISVGGIFPGRPNEGGGFTQKVTPGRFFVEVSGNNQLYYVKSFRLGNEDVMRKPFDFSGGTAEMEIVLGTDAGRVTGSVNDRDGNPMPGAPVSLWPMKRNYMQRNGGALTATTRQDGSFMFTLVPPGDYYAMAFEDLPDPGLAQYPDFLLPFTSKGKRITVDANQQAQASIEARKAEDVARVFASLP